MRALILALVLLTTQAQAVERDARGRIERSARAVSEFRKDTPCPATGRVNGKCPGYIIDHVYPLACGGLDDPLNMMWQTVKEAKLKDRWERRGCQIKPRS